MSDDPRKDAKNLAKTMAMISRNLNTLILLGSDFAVDKIAQASTGYEVASINEDPKQRKELDDALAVVLDYYLSSYLGPGIGYLLCLSTALANRYSFEPVDEDEEDDDEEPSQSPNDSTDGKAGTRQDNDPEGSAKGRNTGKKTKSKKGSASLPSRGRHVS